MDLPLLLDMDRVRLEDFKYPTSEEYENQYKKMVKLHPFNLAYDHDEYSYSIGTSTKDQAERNTHLLEWNYVLLAKISSLNFNYINALSHYERIPPDGKSPLIAHVTDRFLFDQYCESFYNLFFSIVDVLAQMINVCFVMNVEEERVSWNDGFKKKMEAFNLQDTVLKFYKEFSYNTSSAKIIRNGFNHRFPDNQYDYRVKFIGSKPIRKFSSGLKVITSNEDFVENMNDAMKHLSCFMIHLVAVVAI